MYIEVCARSGEGPRLDSASVCCASMHVSAIAERNGFLIKYIASRSLIDLAKARWHNYNFFDR